jgi:glucose/arabinose dehydrogenase
MRNPSGLARTPAPPGSGGAPVLWTLVNERNEIGSALVPDYLTSVREGGFYGWPYS